MEYKPELAIPPCDYCDRKAEFVHYKFNPTIYFCTHCRDKFIEEACTRLEQAEVKQK